MATGDKKVNLFNKRVLSVEDLKDRLADYIEDTAKYAVKSVYRSDGAFDTAITVSASASANRVNVAAASAFLATDGLGNLLSGDSGEADLQNIVIPPDASASTVYHIGLMHALVEREVVINQLGQYKYDYLEETIGVLGTPDAVTVVDDTLVITVDSLLEAGYDHSGRTVRVWLKPSESGGPGPQSSNPAVAFEECMVAYASTHNKITTVTHLGQATPSTIADNYCVLLVGPRVTRASAVDLRSAPGVLFLAEVTAADTGDPIITIVHNEQNVHTNFATNLEEIIENAAGHTKVAVQAQAGESEQRQISVLPSGGGDPVFSVDEDGDVELAGDLLVGGSEIISTTEVVLGSAELGDDPSTDTFSLWAEMRLRAGDKGGSPPYTKWSNIILGNGDEATPGHQIVFNGTNYDTALSAETQGSVYDILLLRDDAVAGNSSLIVRNSGAGGKFGIKSQGDLHIGLGDLSTGPAIVFDVSTASGDWSIYNQASSLYCSANAVADRDFIITNSSTGLAHLLVKGPITINSGSGYLSCDTGALNFLDANLGDVIPLSHASESGGDGLNTTSTSLLGAIEEIRTSPGARMAHRAGVQNLTGLTTTHTSGLLISTSAGSAWVNGKLCVFSSATAQSVAESTNYIYITNAGVISKTTTKATAFADDVLPLAIVVAAGGVVTSIENIRMGLPFLGQKTTITVGKPSANANTDFETLTEALNYVKALADITDSLKRSEVEIVIVGQVDMSTATYSLLGQHSGLRIRGIRSSDVSGLATGGVYTASGYGQSRILWGIGAGSYRLFDVAGGVNDIVFEDLVFVFNSASAAINSALFYAGSGAGATVRGLTFRGCRFTFSGSHAFASIVRVLNGRTINGLTIEKGRVERNSANTGLAGVVHVDSGGVVDHCLVAQMEIYDSTAAITENTFVVRGPNATFRDVEVKDGGMVLQGSITKRLVVSHCQFDGQTGGIWNTGAGDHLVDGCSILINSSGTGERRGIRFDDGLVTIVNNRIHIIGGAASGVSTGIQTIGTASYPGSKICGNSLYVTGGVSGTTGIQNALPFTAIGNNTVSVGDDTNGVGVTNTAAHCTFVGNVIAHNLAGPNVVTGLFSSGDYCTVGYNTARATTPFNVSGTGSIFSDNASRTS